MADPVQPARSAEDEKYPHHEFQSKLPVWHGLSLARQILKSSMPHSEQAVEICGRYEARLRQIVEVLEKNNAGPNTYAGESLETWKLTLVKT